MQGQQEKRYSVQTYDTDMPDNGSPSKVRLDIELCRDNDDVPWIAYLMASREDVEPSMCRSCRIAPGNRMCIAAAAAESEAEAIRLCLDQIHGGMGVIVDMAMHALTVKTGAQA